MLLLGPVPGPVSGRLSDIDLQKMNWNFRTGGHE
jgi:hypothetical protein